MTQSNKSILQQGNAAITAGNYEGFLDLCTDDTEWTFVGDQVLRGKEAVRQYMAEAYRQPPVFDVARLIAEGDYVTALGSITLTDAEGQEKTYDYCDVWHFRDGKMAGLKAFVVEGKA